MEKKGNANLNQRKREKKMKTLPVILIGLMACLAIGVSTARGQAIVYSLEDLGVVKEMETSQPARLTVWERGGHGLWRGVCDVCLPL